MTSAFPLFRS